MRVFCVIFFVIAVAINIWAALIAVLAQFMWDATVYITDD